jgi:hypothetical protein
MRVLHDNVQRKPEIFYHFIGRPVANHSLPILQEADMSKPHSHKRRIRQKELQHRPAAEAVKATHSRPKRDASKSR